MYQWKSVASIAAGNSSSFHTPEYEQEWQGEEHEQIHRITCCVGVAAVETILGYRPLHQMAKWIHPDVFEHLAEMLNLHRLARSKSGAPPVVRPMLHAQRSHIYQVDPNTYESSVVVRVGPRCRTVVMRIVRHRHLWIAQSLEIG